MICRSASTAEWNRKPRLLVLGLGNGILRDDGVGVHAVRSFQQLNPRPCLSVEVGTAVLDAAPMLESADRVLAFDAVKTGGKPGSVYLFRAEDIEENPKYDSLHEMGLIKVLQMLRRPPAEVVIIGAEPHIIGWGIGLSPALDFAVTLMVSTAQKVIAKWKQLDSDHGQIDLASIAHTSQCEIALEISK